MELITVVYNGRTYRRYPKSKKRDARVYYRARYGGKTHFLHRVIYTDAFGPIPSGMHVHHKDHNTFNNQPSNLQALDGAEHSRRHFQQDAKRWHTTSEGRAWHANHARTRKLKSRTKPCEECGRPFKAPQSNRRFCSKRCWNKSWRRRNPEKANAILQRYYLKRAKNSV